METISANWYDYPHLYDIAFSWDASLEIDFLVSMFEQYAHGPVERVFEPFCGTGRLAIPLARRGYRVCGMDINSSAIAFAEQRCATERAEVDLSVGDVAAWTTREPVDAVVTLIDSFRHLTSAEQARAALRAFHVGLRPGGVLVIGLQLGDTPIEADDSNHWEMERDGTVVETIVAGLRKAGRTPGTTVVRSVLRVTEAGGRQYDIITDDEMREYTLASLKQLAHQCGPFEFQAGYSFEDLGSNQILDSDDPQGNTVAVFVRR